MFKFLETNSPDLIGF